MYEQELNIKLHFSLCTVYEVVMYVFMSVGLSRGSQQRTLKNAPGSYHVDGNDVETIILYKLFGNPIRNKFIMFVMVIDGVVI